MKLLRLLIILFFVSISYQVNAGYQDIDSKTKLVYEKFYSQVKSKNKIDNGLSYLHSIDMALEKLSNSSKINRNNYKIFSDLQKLNNEKIFELELEKIEKVNKKEINKFPILNNYEKFSYNDDFIFKKDGFWYAYIFSENYFFEKFDGISKAQLMHNGIYSKDVLFFYNNEKINFADEYREIKLIKDDIIYGFPDKYNLLKTIKGNKILDSIRDDEKYFEDIKKISIDLTKNIFKTDEKIKIIYDYILNKISYSNNFTMQDYEVFSGVETFINKSGVCEGYVELFNLMLGFNDIRSEITTGDVIDAEDFPQIGHAWIKISDYYYDITFDDPVGASKTKTFEQYNYYKLPRDIFYTNRFDKGETPENLKTATLEYRKNLIKINLSKLTTKYKNSNYNLLKPFIFKQNYNIDPLKSITVKDIIDTIGYKEMKNYEIIINGTKKSVKSFNYILLEDETIEVFLEQVDYDISGYMILKWFKDDGKTEFIITNNIVYID